MELEIRHLRVICTIAETGSLTRAAAALKLTQPGLSAQLTRIETMLGGRLFERTSAGATPTAFGEVVLTRARAVLPTIDELLGATALAARTGPAPRRFRLGSINAPLLGGLISAIRSHHPAAEITSREQGSPVALIDDLANGRLEAAVVGDCPGYELTAPPGVVQQPIATEPAFVALHSGHRLASHSEVSLDDLASEDWVLPRPDNDRTREYWSKTFLDTGHQMHTAHEAEGRLLLELVRSGHAVTLCQPTFEEHPGVAVRPIAGNPIWYRYSVAWHQDGPLAAIRSALIQHCTRAYETAIARSPVYQRWLQRAGGHPDLLPEPRDSRLHAHAKVLSVKDIAN